MMKYIVIYTPLGFMNILKEIQCKYSIDEQLEYYQNQYSNCKVGLIELDNTITDEELKENYNIIKFI